MAVFNKFNALTEHLGKKIHKLDTDALTLALSNTAPVATNSVLADIVQIAYTNLSARVLQTVTFVTAGGVATLDAADITLTATGAVATYRYIVLYNDTAAAPAIDALIGWYDHGAAITLANTETHSITFAASGILTIT